MTEEEQKKQEAIQKAVSEWNASKPEDYKEFIVFVSYDQNNEIGFKLSNGCCVGPYNSDFAV